jgi:hypothetical protein
MNNAQLEGLARYVSSNAPHECGHMTVLFKAARLAGLNYFPNELAANGVKGVFETDTGTQLVKQDCVALAAGMIGELVGVGSYVPEQLLDDRKRVHELVGQPLEIFAREAYEVIQQNLLFFVLLSLEVHKKMFAVLVSPPNEDKVPVLTLAEVQKVYGRAQTELARFPDKAGPR